jgi:hypothetical protein
MCASDFLRDDSFGNAAPVAWFGQACAAQLDLDSQAVLSIMRYPQEILPKVVYLEQAHPSW